MAQVELTLGRTSGTRTDGGRYVHSFTGYSDLRQSDDHIYTKNVGRFRRRIFQSHTTLATIPWCAFATKHYKNRNRTTCRSGPQRILLNLSIKT